MNEGEETLPTAFFNRNNFSQLPLVPLNAVRVKMALGGERQGGKCLQIEYDKHNYILGHLSLVIASNFELRGRGLFRYGGVSFYYY